MKNFCLKYKYIISLILLSLLVFGLSYAHQGSLIIDSGREVYYPKRILEGAVLYKDLFNIYGPFAYLYNAFLFKFFGLNINVLYLSGVLTMSVIVACVYLLSRQFFDKFLAFSIASITIIIGGFSFHVFNYVFPYSFSMTYGMAFCLISIYLLIQFIRKNNSFLYYLSTFFAGLAISNKYEFLPYCLIFIYIAFKNKLSIKQNIVSFVTLIIAPFILFEILFLQGLGLQDLIGNLKDIYAMSKTNTLNYFYSISGLTFQKQTLGLLTRNFLMTIFPIALIYNGTYYIDKSKIKAYFLYALAVFFTFKLASLETFIFLPLVLFVLMCVFLKKQSQDVKVLSISAFLVSLKVFWATALNSYGVFFIPILLIATICFIKKDFKNFVSIYLVLVSIAFFVYNLPTRKEITYPIKTSMGKIYVTSLYKDTSNNIIKFINENTKPTDKILILPEGLFFNYLTNRVSDDYYNSYLPLYVETFGESRLINSLKNNKPDYIILHNFPTSDYYFKSMCNDYGFEICDFIKNEYSPKGLLYDSFTAYVFKKK